MQENKNIDIDKEIDNLDIIPNFREFIASPLYTKDKLNTLQMNITRRCNLACKHCHVECSPSRVEDMDISIAEKSLELFKKEGFKILDITGGAPEMSSSFKFLVEEGSKLADKVMVRSNLTIHLLPEYEGYLEFMADKKVELICSLPFYERDKTDRARGVGVYDESIEVLKKLMQLGYGKEKELVLNLVYNPSGAILPGNQVELEDIYREKLANEYDIYFNNLFSMTNVPLGRFGMWLKKSNNLNRYMTKLFNAFNVATLEDLMCRDMISIDYDGSLYDCDFNLSMGLKVKDEPKNIDDALKIGLTKRNIALGNHCYACTAGAGSS